MLVVLENAPTNHRGLLGSMVQIGNPIGVLAAVAIFSLVSKLPDQELMSWGLDRISCTRQKRISAQRRDQAEFFNAIRRLQPSPSRAFAIAAHCEESGRASRRCRRI